jgi:MSHA biogenesis protein MshP
MSMRNHALADRAQRGIGVIGALVVLVFLSALAAAVVRLNFSEQITSGQDLASARAAQAASSGIEWGLYQALKGSWTTCSGVSQTLDLRADLGVRVTVSCSSTTFSEGEVSEGVPQTVRLYTLDAVACNGASTCPDNSRVGSPGYVERKRTVQLSN